MNTVLGRRLLLGAPAILLTKPARADWPEKPLRLVVAFPPGSGTDVLARVLAPALSRELGQSIVVDNRPGGNGVVGTLNAAAAPPDGYTILIISSSAASINPHTVKNIPYNVARDFVMIGALAEAPYVLCVHPNGPQNLQSFLDFVRSKQGEATFSYGNASALIMTSVMAQMAGVRMTPIPYRGGAESLTDVAAGRIDCTFADFGPGSTQAQGGQVRIIGHSLPHTFPVAPDLPSVSTVVPGFDMSVWWGLAAPAGTPAAIVTRVNQALNAALASPEVVTKLRMVGDEPLRMSPAAMTRYVAQQHTAWGERVRIAGIEPQ
ncbi:Bug family tripartite tricarboxylate transporter substrate binding protein [Pararoseomonas indoligenes]|uniref:Tripartite tricarboxylate transporter substrate binding protein n=1 Tax=Roseomonas indoligenes TaxID=2820811 RepID=A0A940S9X8_9PROT|nr:tripartite tricarboxylate transporter substrate binding protein [Pararoseomonas indoligenes]MBP0495748.1 tripartite tricarboxylate transporter substrate binding protein [Pararoseomonas indoligenes]